ncbi:MAG: AEC family transporter [Melioribacteraceae bacterium]|nr:AEC family transporter [Melioribacteraceae bacterium]
MDNLLYIVNVVSPVFFLVTLGIFLRYIKAVNESFIDLTSKFVFNVSLPVLVFLKLYEVNLTETFDLPFVLFISTGTALTFGLSWLISLLIIGKRNDRGVFIQGAFRGNYAIVGLAIVMGMFGSDALSKASLMIPFLLPIYNFSAVIALTVYSNHQIKLSVGKLTKDIMLNPLILGVLAALPFALLKIDIPQSVKISGEYLSSIALPLALIGIGGSLNFEAIKKASRISIYATALKIILFPFLASFSAYQLGFTGIDLGIIFVIFSCPTAIASFVMAIAMGGSGKIAGNIIVLSTLGSVLTMTVGLYILKSYNLI